MQTMPTVGKEIAQGAAAYMGTYVKPQVDKIDYDGIISEVDAREYNPVVIYEGAICIALDYIVQDIRGTIKYLQQDMPDVDTFFFRDLQVDYNAGHGVISIVGDMYRMTRKGLAQLTREVALDIFVHVQEEWNTYLRVVAYRGQRNLADTVFFHMLDRFGML